MHNLCKPVYGFATCKLSLSREKHIKILHLMSFANISFFISLKSVSVEVRNGRQCDVIQLAGSSYS